MGVFLPNSPQVGVELLGFPPQRPSPALCSAAAKSKAALGAVPMAGCSLNPLIAQGRALHAPLPRADSCASFECSRGAGEELMALLCLQALPT